MCRHQAWCDVTWERLTLWFDIMLRPSLRDALNDIYMLSAFHDPVSNRAKREGVWLCDHKMVAVWRKEGGPSRIWSTPEATRSATGRRYPESTSMRCLPPNLLFSPSARPHHPVLNGCCTQRWARQGPTWRPNTHIWNAGDILASLFRSVVQSPNWALECLYLSFVQNDKLFKSEHQCSLQRELYDFSDKNFCLFLHY